MTSDSCLLILNHMVHVKMNEWLIVWINVYCSAVKISSIKVLEHLNLCLKIFPKLVDFPSVSQCNKWITIKFQSTATTPVGTSIYEIKCRKNNFGAIDIFDILYLEVTLPFYMIPRSCINSIDHQKPWLKIFLTWNDDTLEYKCWSWMKDNP